MNIKFLILPVLGLSMAGCSYYHSQEAGPIDPEAFGEANRQTFAAMVVNPDPVYEEDMTSSAEVASDAVEAYREGTVEEPESGGLNFSSGGGGGS